MSAPNIPTPAAEKIPPTYADITPDRRVQMKHVPTGEVMTFASPDQADAAKRFSAKQDWQPMPPQK